MGFFTLIRPENKVKLDAIETIGPRASYLCLQARQASNPENLPGSPFLVMAVGIEFVLNQGTHRSRYIFRMSSTPAKITQTHAQK